MINTDKAWEKWGREDPYFGVLADERFSADNIASNRDEFFAAGRGFVTHLLRRYEHMFGPLPRGSALDHGCGVGRLTFPLARQFEHASALDISPSMLAEARANAEEFKASNIDFALADDDLSNAQGQFDFVNSHIVLQHIPVRRGMAILARLVDRVRPGGGFHLHVSFRTEPALWRLLYWSSANIPGVKIWQNICAGRAWNAPAMQMNDYSLNAIVASLAAQGIADVFLSSEQHGRFVTCSLIGRKPDRS